MDTSTAAFPLFCPEISFKREHTLKYLQQDRDERVYSAE